MKVAIISPLPPEKPGESIYTARLIEALAKHRDIEITAIGGLSSMPLTIPRNNVTTASIWNCQSLLYPFALWRFIKKRGIQLVHVQYGPHGEVYGGLFGEVMLFLLLLLKYTGVKTTVTLHSTWMLEQVKLRLEETPRFSIFSIFSSAIFKIFMKLLYWGTNTVQLSTVRIGSVLKRRFLNEFKFNPDNVLEIPHACTEVVTNLSKEDAMSQLGVSDRQIILVFGFIRRDKGIHLAMKAVEELRETIPNILLLVAGKPFDEDGTEYLRELRKLRREKKLYNNVRFDTQYIPEEIIPVYFSAASIILAPYTESIGASGPLHSAGGYGRPIVASDAGMHIGEALGGNIVTYDQENIDSFCEKLKLVLTNKELAQEIQNKLIQYSKSESWDKAAERTIAYYRKTLGIEGAESK